MKLRRKQVAEYIVEKAHKRGLKGLAKEIAALLLHEKSVTQLNSLMRDIQLEMRDRGIIDVVAVSAHELSNKVINDIKVLLKEEFPNAKKFNVSTRIDEAVVGGVRLEMPGEQLDLTVRDRLAHFRHLTDAIKE